MAKKTSKKSEKTQAPRKDSQAKGSRRSKSPSEMPQFRTCATSMVHHMQLEADPGFRTRQMEIEKHCQDCMSRRLSMPKKPNKIQCVVHILYNQASQNISDAQIESQIEVLNNDFRAKNSDIGNVPAVWSGLVADSMIEFELASKSPSGANTNGITRTKTSVTAFAADDSMKFSNFGGIDAWNAQKYLNIWVCNVVDTSGTILGYAQFPGGPPTTDGIVILSQVFGTTGSAVAPFNRGRTTTHEVGHYLNLRHIWGDEDACLGSDRVDDTPNAATANFGEPAFPSISCNNGPDGDMFMNYMDYVDDGAMFMFTHGQVARMRATLSGARKTLIS